MAKARMKIPDDFLQKISRLGNKTDEIVPKVLKEGAKVISRKTKSNLAGVIGKNTKVKSRSTGELMEALGESPVGLDKNGNHNIKVGFREGRTDGATNALIANVLEYGKSGQPPKPFLKPAVSVTKREVVAVMEETFDREVESL